MPESPPTLATLDVGRGEPEPARPDLRGELESIKAALDAEALTYDPATHGRLEPVGSYDGGDGRHRVCINLHPDVDWRVIDVSPDGSATLVGRLDGIDDLRRQAVACARDYAAECRRFHVGGRRDQPILRPKPMRIMPGGLGPDATDPAVGALHDPPSGRMP